MILISISPYFFRI